MDCGDNSVICCFSIGFSLCHSEQPKPSVPLCLPSDTFTDDMNDDYVSLDDDSRFVDTETDANLYADDQGGDDVVFSRDTDGVAPVIHCQRHDYVYRPASLSDISLYRFNCFYKKTKLPGRPEQEKILLTDTEHPLSKSHFLATRSKPRIPVFVGARIPNAEMQPEENARMKLLLFKPFRSGADLRRPGQTWSDALVEYIASLLKAKNDAVCQDTLRWLANVDALHEGESQVKKERKERIARAAEEGDLDLQRDHRDGWFDEKSIESPFDYDGSRDFPDDMHDDGDELVAGNKPCGLTSAFMQTLLLSTSPVCKSTSEEEYAKAVLLAARSAGFLEPCRSALERTRRLTITSVGRTRLLQRPSTGERGGSSQPAVGGAASSLDGAASMTKKWSKELRLMSQEVCYLVLTTFILSVLGHEITSGHR
jgi:hypothetical protein